MTLATIGFMILVFGLVAVMPAVFDAASLPTQVRVALDICRWVLLALLISLALAVVYRVAPDRDAPQIRWVSIGAAVATVLWLITSLGFSLYVDSFGNYAESEEQTARDTTTGSEQPLGRRGAVKADSLPPRPE
jgi:membrane protein